MANLKQDLDEYLLLQSDQKKNFNIKMPNIKLPQMFTRNQEPEEANNWLIDTPKFSRLQRIVGFFACLGLGTLCMTISTFYIPVLLLKARKFALLYTMGSIFFVIGFCFLSGSFLRQMFSRERVWVSSSYTVFLIATLYFALFVQSTALTVLFAVAQIISLLLMILGAVPGGAKGIKFFGQLFKSSVSSSALPV